MPNLLGTNPNQTPTVGDLGSMAFQDENAVNIGGGLVQADLTGNSWNQNTDISTVQPSLRLDFDKMLALDPRITFGRSGVPGSYYDGKTFALAEQNFWLYSQDADNAAWQKSNMAVAANAVMAPDGTMTADAIALGTAGTGASIGPVLLLPAGTFVMSIYAKAGTNTVFDFRYTAQGVASYGVTVDLGAGTIVNQVGSTSGETLTNVGGGWYRASFVFTLGSASIAGSSPYLRGNSASVSGSTMFIWGAQLEQRSAVSAYTPTTSAAITNYIPQLMTAAANQARFDFDPITGECKGLLVEEQRANLAIYAEQFDNAAWNGGTSVVAPNVSVAPDGALTADMLTIDSVNNSRRQTITGLTVGATYTFSCYVKAASINPATGIRLTTNNTVAWNAGGSAYAALTSQWQRVSITWTQATTTSAYLMPGAITVSGSNDDNCFGNVLIWGAQLEAGSFATSYIPTTSAQVTRSKDDPQITGTAFSQWFNPIEGTVVIELQKPQANTGGASQYLFNLAGGSASTRIEQYNNVLFAELRADDGSNQVDLPSYTVTAANTLMKVALAYKTNDVACASWHSDCAFAFPELVSGHQTPNLLPQTPDER